MAEVVPKILFVSGGSGGHIAPLFTIMDAVEHEANRSKFQIELHYAGGSADIASELVSHSALHFSRHPVRSGKLHRFFTLDQFRQCAQLILGMYDAWKVVHVLRPSLVFAKGSAVSVPVAFAAWLHGIPVFCHETDVRPGLANALVGKVAQRIFTSYPTEAYPQLPQNKLLYVGQPVRPAFFNPDLEKDLVIGGRLVPKNVPLLTIVGGSQGAHKINELIQEKWEAILERLYVVHQTGSRDYEQLSEKAKRLPEQLREKLFSAPFISEGMPELFARSTIVISRSGGIVAELAAVKAATILLPLTGSAQDHQWANARWLERTKSVKVLDEQTVSPDDLWREVDRLLENQTERQKMAAALHALGKPEAAKHIAEDILKCARDPRTWKPD